MTAQKYGFFPLWRQSDKSLSSVLKFNATLRDTELSSYYTQSTIGKSRQQNMTHSGIILKSFPLGTICRTRSLTLRKWWRVHRNPSSWLQFAAPDNEPVLDWKPGTCISYMAMYDRTRFAMVLAWKEGRNGCDWHGRMKRVKEDTNPKTPEWLTCNVSQVNSMLLAMVLMVKWR